MKIAVYPGSFNPFHQGHLNVVRDALKVFDRVIIARGVNPDKMLPQDTEMEFMLGGTGNILFKLLKQRDKVHIVNFTGLLKDFIEQHDVSAIVKGLRNPTDLEYEKTQQYWNEDLGIKVPTFFVISGRAYTHISSSAIRAVKSMEKK